VALDFRELHSRLDRRDHAFRDAVLQVEHVAEIAVKTIGPQMHAGERRRSVCPVIRRRLPPRRTLPFEHVSDAEFASDLSRISTAFAFEDAGRIAGDDEQAAAARQRGDDGLPPCRRRNSPAQDRRSYW